MTSAMLQWIAVLTMAVDHAGYLLFPEIPFLRAVGRLSFPIFSFLLAEGFRHTSNRKKYALRLAVFAVLSELPYELFLYGSERIGTLFPMKNVLFSLLLAFGALWCTEQGGGFLFGSALLILGAELGGFSYGAYGVLLTLCFFLCGRAFSGEEDPEGARRKRGLLAAALLAACTALYCAAHRSLFQSWAVFAAIPLFFYSGERGKRMPRYFFYVFYPAHLLLLLLLKSLS